MNKEVIGWLGWGVGILVLALAARWARELGYIEGDTVKRLVIGATGLMIAWSGNAMPKAFVPIDWVRQAKRVAGWSTVVSGLIYAGLWAFAPLEVAKTAGVMVVLSGIAFTIVYCVTLRNRAKAV